MAKGINLVGMLAKLIAEPVLEPTADEASTPANESAIEWRPKRPPRDPIQQDPCMKTDHGVGRQFEPND